MLFILFLMTAYILLCVRTYSKSQKVQIGIRRKPEGEKERQFGDTCSMVSMPEINDFLSAQAYNHPFSLCSCAYFFQASLAWKAYQEARSSFDSARIISANSSSNRAFRL